MIELALDDLAAMVDGTVVDAAVMPRVRGPVVVDSRLAEPGALFVALRGEHTDGHEHASAAVEAGAAAVLAARPVGVPAVVVPDVLAALGELARGVLDRLREAATAPGGGARPVVVALTGSSGKTSTKDLLADVLAVTGTTVATQGSLNNEIGLPLTVLTADRATDRLVLEMGARGQGHIGYLCRIAPPRIGVVLNVGAAHVGEFGGREATARAKQELVEALPPAAGGGVAVLNADDPLVRGMATATAARVVTFGLGPDADIRAESLELDERGRASFDLVTPEGARRARLDLVGAHHVANALAAAAVAREVGMPVDVVADALRAHRPRSRWRMEVTERADGVTVVNDAYNANPDSMRAALEALAVLARGRRSWAVLGEMLELGAASDEEHRSVGRLVARLGVTRLVAVGEGARRVRDGALDLGGPDGPTDARTDEEVERVVVADADAALALLRAQLRPGDVVLVKASRAGGLERVAAGLLADVPAVEGSPG